jgi:3-deoxy-D-manno-octulosonic-acid transferase
MDLLDGIYCIFVSFVGCLCRSISKGLPKGVRLRLEAKAPDSVELGWIWLHAVSVGELLLAVGLLDKLVQKGHRVHVTTGTEAGLDLLNARLPAWGVGTGQVSGGAFPLDDRRGLQGFFEASPGAFIALETEIWPNLYKELESKNIPICIVNGRLTDRTLASWFAPWLRRAASRLSLVAARDPESIDHFRSLGAPNVVLGGNLKADAPVPQALHDGWKALEGGWNGMPIVVAGNTVEGEEALIVFAWKHAKESHPGLRLMIAPRQPRRFESVAKFLDGEGIPYQRAAKAWTMDRSQWLDTQVLLLDTMGELAFAYKYGHIALVGGGWRWHGGHNPLEPLHWGVPTLIGPGFENFEDLVKPLMESRCLGVVGEQGLAEAILSTLSQVDPNAEKIRESKIPDSLRGFFQRTWDCLMPYLPARKDPWR